MSAGSACVVLLAKSFRGVKREKYGEPDRAKLAKEVQNVLTCALQVALYYGVEQELADSFERSYQRLKAEGYIEEGP